MRLQDVIGVEIPRSGLNEQAVDMLKGGGLVIEEIRRPDFKPVQSVDPRSVSYASFSIRTRHGSWAGSMMVVPRGIKAPPGIFVLDEGCRHLQFPAKIPDGISIDDFEGPTYSSTQLGSHLIGMGFTVAFPTPKTLTRASETMALGDWITLIKRFVSRSRIDTESLFLIATGEHAELALRLASRLDFAGVVIEAPFKMMFVQAQDGLNERADGRIRIPGQSPDSRAPSANPGSPADPVATDNSEDPWKDSFFRSEAHMIRYVEHARSLKAPLMVVLDKEAPSYEQAKKTLLTSLVAVDADFSVALLERSTSSPLQPKNQTQNSPAVSYDNVQFEQWILRLEEFLLIHSSTKPVPLPLFDRESPGPGGFSRGAFNDMTVGPSAVEGYFPAEETPLAGDRDPRQ